MRHKELFLSSAFSGPLNEFRLCVAFDYDFKFQTHGFILSQFVLNVLLGGIQETTHGRMNNGKRRCSLGGKVDDGSPQHCENESEFHALYFACNR